MAAEATVRSVEDWHRLLGTEPTRERVRRLVLVAPEADVLAVHPVFDAAPVAVPRELHPHSMTDTERRREAVWPTRSSAPHAALYAPTAGSDPWL